MEDSSQKKKKKKKPLLPWATSMLQMERKEKERKKVNQSKIGQKQKKRKKIWKGSWTKQCLNKYAELSKAKKKGKATVTITWLKPEGCMKWIKHIN